MSSDYNDFSEYDAISGSFFELSLDLLCIASLDGYFLKLNTEWERTLGYTIEDLQNVPFISLVHPDDVESTLQAMQRLDSHESILNFTNRYRCSDGSYKWIEWRSIPRDGVIYASARDVTEHQNTLQHIREKEEYLRRLSNNVADGMIYQLDCGKHGESRQFLYISSGVERLHNTTVEEALKAPEVVYNTICYKDIETLARLEREAIAEEKTFRAEARVTMNDGSERWSLFVSEPHRDQKGHIIFDGIEIDITEQKRYELEKIESELKYRRLIEGLGEKHCIFSHSAEGVFIYASKSFENLFGIPAQEMIGKDWRILNLSDKSIERGNETDQRILTEHIHQTVELECTHPDGSVHIIEVHYGPVLENNTVVRMEGICTDITEQKRYEQLLIQSNKRLDEAQRLAHIGNWELNLQTNELYWSDEIYKIFGIDREEFDASYDAFLAAIHPEDRDSVNTAYQLSLKTQKPYAITHRLLMKNGEIKYVHEQCYTDFAADGTPLISTGTVQDITALRESEEEQKKLQEQLNQSQKMEAIGKLAGGVAHDFNNMLGVILGHAEELLETIPQNSPYNESLIELRKAAERSADLTRQLLTFSRQQTITPHQLNLNETIESMLKMLHRLIGENIAIEWNPSVDETPVFMDPSQVNQILANLCVNARDAISGSGTIRITTKKVFCEGVFCKEHEEMLPGEYILLTVSDTGHGMDKDTALRIFDPFFTTKEVGQGTGLGLSTVYGITKQNGGIIEVESEESHGSTFSLYIPVHHTQSNQPVSHPHEDLPLSGTETILLVEDEVMLLHTLTKVLARNGYNVIPVESPEKALSIASEQKGSIDLLITDVIMPNINGRDLATAIEMYNPDIRVLFMSGYTATIIASDGVLDDRTHFIQKPFQFEKFLLKIRETLHSERS